MKPMILKIALIWLLCGLLARGYILGGFTMEFPDQNNSPEVTGLSLLTGPVALGFAALFAAEGAPYMLHGYNCQQRWAAFKQNNGILGKDFFVHWAGNYGCRNERLD